jgi:hypothetical protein
MQSEGFALQKCGRFYQKMNPAISGSTKNGIGTALTVIFITYILVGMIGATPEWNDRIIGVGSD